MSATRVGTTVICQNYGDWDRYEAAERGDSVPTAPAVPDRQIIRRGGAPRSPGRRTRIRRHRDDRASLPPCTMVTNPIQLLTYLAGRTERVDLGTMVIVLPWHNPVRVAEGIEIIRRLLATGECSFDGQYFSVDQVRLRPRPGRDMSDSLLCAAGSPETMEVVAELDIKPLIIPTAQVRVALGGAQNYMRLRDDAGLPPVKTKMAMWTYCASTPEEAEAGAERYMLEYADSALRRYELGGSHFDDLKGYRGYAKMAEILRKDDTGWRRSVVDGHPWGTPDQIIDQVRKLSSDFGTSEISFVFRYGSMPRAEAEASMRLFAAEVLPALHEMETEPMRLAAA